MNDNGHSKPSVARQIRIHSDYITLSAASTRIAEGDTGTTTDVAITVTLSKPAPTELRIPMNAMRSSTARGNRPCGSNPLDDICGPVSFAITQGATSVTYTVTIAGDTRNEDDETAEFRTGLAGWSTGSIRLIIADNESDTATATPGPPTAVPATNTHTPAPTDTHTPVPATATHTPTGTRSVVAASPLQPTHTHTTVPPRVRLYQRRSHEGYTPGPTPVVRCPAPRRSL